MKILFHHANHRKYTIIENTYGKFFLIFSIKPTISFSYFLQSSKTLYCKFSYKDSIIISIIFFKLRREYKNLRRNPSYTHFKRYQFQGKSKTFELRIVLEKRLCKSNNTNTFLRVLTKCF